MSRALPEVTVLGDTLLDHDIEGVVERHVPDSAAELVDERAERRRPGGAGLAATLVAAQGRPVTLVTALAADSPGRELARLLEAAGVDVVDLGITGSTPEKVRIRSAGSTIVGLDRGGPAGRIGPASDAAIAAISRAAVTLVADYGRGVAADEDLRAALAGAGGQVVWDPHPRGPAPVRGTTVVTPNVDEAAALAPEVDGEGFGATVGRARRLLETSGAGAVCVTLGPVGALLARPDSLPVAVPATPVPVTDTCGAGDSFAASLAGSLADGLSLDVAVLHAATAAGRFVRGESASAEPAGGEERAQAIADQVRAAGGAVVATGGCFDGLHPGHLLSLQSARKLGDCLIVCLNSDASVRKLKGEGRPLLGQADRLALLEALECVDAVAVFDERTPSRLLGRLRPDVWVKGSDYSANTMPEAEDLPSWGGEAVLVPLRDGFSTTRLARDGNRPQRKGGDLP